jgi:hypothetical protein
MSRHKCDIGALGEPGGEPRLHSTYLGVHGHGRVRGHVSACVRACACVCAGGDEELLLLLLLLLLWVLLVLWGGGGGGSCSGCECGATHAHGVEWRREQILLTMDLLVLASMKNAVMCEK